MGTSSLSQESVSEFLSIPRNDMERSYLNRKCSCGKNCTLVDIEITELGTALSSILDVQGSPLPIPSCIRASDLNEKCQSETGKLCEESEGEARLSTESTQKVLNKSATFPSPTKPQVGMDGITSTELDGNGFSHNPVCSRSLSLPAPLKLVPAMKGGREKVGIAPPEKLTVKWAPDVVDPPVTSVSHTVKSHSQQQRSSSRSYNKKHGKHKHKGKSSRGNNNSDKKQYRKYTCNSDSLCSISQLASDRLQHLDGFEQSTVELVDIVVSGPDSSNCGSSFLKASLTKMHISVTEAT